MKKFLMVLVSLAFMLGSCAQADKAEKPEPPVSEKTDAAELPGEVTVAHFEAILKHVGHCKKDPVCKKQLEASEPLLGSCPWYEAVGCGVVVAAAGAACVVTEGEACLPAIKAVAAIGCCDCLPSGKVQDICKSL